MFKTVSIEKFLDSKYDILIDARSPHEFLESNIPSSQNFFALSDVEHKEVGTLYKKISSSQAKVLGASYICKNASKHLLEIYKNHKIGSKIGIYCARGGLRSSSLGIIFSNTDYKVEKLEGGYKSYRRYVLDYLDSFPHENFISLYGNTGCGKSELIEKLPNSIDLEGMAGHFGSTFGSIKGVQPSQKEFQNLIVNRLESIDKKEWIFIEAESKKIGSVVQPDLFFKRTHSKVCVLVTAPLEQRIQRILKFYEQISEEFFTQCMDKIKPYIKKTSFNEANESFIKKDLYKVAHILLVDYYDKVYRKPEKVDFTLHLEDIDKALEELQAFKNSLKY